MSDPDRLQVLLARAASLPEAQQRRVAAILGAVVADAAGEAYAYVYTSPSNFCTTFSAVLSEPSHDRLFWTDDMYRC